MKKLLTPFLIGFVLVISGCATNNSVYQYPFQTAKIEYAISGTTEGKSTILIKGDKSVRESHVIFHKASGDENQDNLFIDDGRYVTSVDLNKKVATMTVNPLYSVLIKVDPSQRQELLKKFAVGLSPESSATQEIKPLSTQTVAGQSCDVYDTGGFGQLCLWYGVLLKTSISIPDLGLTNNTVATSVQTDIDIPDSSFEVPAGITVQKVGIDEQASGSTEQTQG